MISLGSWASEYIGTWGTGIFSNDTACDVRNMYRNYPAYRHKDDMAEEKVTKKRADGRNGADQTGSG